MTPRARWIVLLVCSAFFISATLAHGGFSGTPHDFSNSPAFPHLSGKLCTACHPAPVNVKPDFGNDFPGGVPVVAEPGYRLNPDLPEAMVCLGCHDGAIRTPTGTDTMTASPYMNNANLNWSMGGSHNIWGMGQDSAYHPVQIHYPPEPSEKVWDPYRTMPVAADNNIAKGADGRWYIVDPAITNAGLPLVTDPNNPNKAYISCITCHDPHRDNAFYALKRLDWPELCFMCHRG